MSTDDDPEGRAYANRRLNLMRAAIKLTPLLLPLVAIASYFVFRASGVIIVGIVGTTIGVWAYRNYQLRRAMQEVDRELAEQERQRGGPSDR